MSRIAIIPARSGSKGLKDKNIKMMCGKPLLAYSIQAAKDSGCFDTIMVSTDSEQYAEIARSNGAEVPFLRSAETSGDKAGSWDVVKEVLKKYESFGKEFQNVCLLQPTSPLRTSEDIKKAYQLYENKQAGIVISV
ncbi:MAG: acylneuraminate cytidylyltransferase family protein, partial [Lachnospiraceae bacterium]|nr:acylneuraminate cytidylyltransferase family protein [Lachnospiraceae bacterium]